MTGQQVTSITDLRAGLQKYKQEAPASFDGSILLRLLTDGDWVYGAENTEIEDDSLWAVNPMSICHGYCCWVDGELVGEVMVPFTKSVPPMEELREHDEPWKRQISVQLACINGSDKGLQVLYKNSSDGGKRFHQALVEAISDHLDEDQSTPVPIVKLSNTHYNHKKYGKTYKPEFEVVDWVAADAKATHVDDAEEKAEPEPEAKAEQEEEQPVRRRRRRRSA